MYIALSGRPGSGKTTLAKALEAKGYKLINFTDLLKQRASEALHVSVAEIKENKEKYRAFLQEYATLIGFQTNYEYVYQALGDWFLQGSKEPCVFDNVRTPEQWEVLKGLGFVLVEVWNFKEEYASKGITLSDHPLEKGMNREADIDVLGFLTTGPNIDYIERVGKELWEQRTKSLLTVG